jgi:hypothetical protein
MQRHQPVWWLTPTSTGPVTDKECWLLLLHRMMHTHMKMVPEGCYTMAHPVAVGNTTAWSSSAQPRCEGL